MAQRPGDGPALSPGASAGRGVTQTSLALSAAKGWRRPAPATNRPQGLPAQPLALLIQSYNGKAGEEKLFLTSLPVDDPLASYDAYDLRSLIENGLFRELKQGWHLLAFPKQSEDAVRGVSSSCLK